MLDMSIVPRLFNPVTIFESASTLALIMHVERAIGKGGPPTFEHLRLRAGVAEGVELLDKALNVPGASYARRAVHVLREVIEKVDSNQ